MTRRTATTLTKSRFYESECASAPSSCNRSRCHFLPELLRPDVDGEEEREFNDRRHLELQGLKLFFIYLPNLHNLSLNQDVHPEVYFIQKHELVKAIKKLSKNIQGVFLRYIYRTKILKKIQTSCSKKKF